MERSEVKIMIRTLTYEIPTEYDGKKLLEYLRHMRYSAPVITHLKRTPRGILLNDEWARTSDLLHENDRLTIRIVENESSPNIVPVSLPLHIVYEDKDIMVINKPAGMPIHPSQGNYDNTLANAVCYYFKQLGINYVYRCITRLDRDTTGLLLLAKNMYSASLMSDDIKNRRIHREYLAVVSGILPPEGVIDAPIARTPDSTIEREVNMETGAPARTHYKLLYHENGWSLAALSLETGRTHQIRVHMKHIGHPLPGDFLYNPDMSVIQRQALHSHKIQFPHPVSGDLMQFTAPLPDDMKQFFSENTGY